MLKHVQTTTQLHSSHTLAKECSIFCNPGFNSTLTMNFQMFKLDLEKAEESEIKLPTSAGSLKNQDSSRKTSTSALLTMLKPLTMWITTNWKILREVGIPDHLTCLLHNLYAGQEAQCSCLENPRAGGAWWAAVYGVAQSWTRLK